MIQIAGYENLEVLGRGGFAVVYRARQISVGREVAIKVLSDPAPDADTVRRFERESKAVGALSWHPHIAAVVDAGTTETGQAYIVFELLPRGSLEDAIESGPLAWPTAVAAMIQVADAVEAAHRDDVLHRDIKPGNILLDRLGDAKLADFGIASMQDGTKTETGMLATTVAHAAPELFLGAPASVTTDVYALGSTLHNLLGGRPPFESESDERLVTTINRIASEPPPSLTPATAPPPIAAVITHALAKQPEYRLRSAAEFGHALQQAQQALGQAVTAMPVCDDARTATPAHPFGPATAPVEAGPQSASHSVSYPVATAPPLSPPPGHPPSGSIAPPPGHPPNRSLSRLIGVLAAIAGVLAAVIGGILLFDLFGDPPVATTAGGVEIRDFDVLRETEMPGRPGASALDLDETTYWGIQPNVDAELNIAGTTFVLGLEGEHTLTGVGISNGADESLGRVAVVRWATSIDELVEGGPSVYTQTIPDAPGSHVDAIRLTTDQIVLQIVDLHDIDRPNAGIAELLLEGE